ncbi:MAG: DMT family transporter [Pseudotabrizicola sp.]|uniref:DMT family transporter n=1 Tax=Pseudotabrizicola sp. TaxID=2939647 RepID=UPI002725F2BF|nr:DMT family transporter [Pseudotabrizicola sp.]MDO8882346.1 DMT family transporter [Pseudotabrizicola sp.]MDP2079782.1 DMT family transporter [Pseudotabrizicola sp.]MDZ7574783.1 DMT family transporter [Pseudotabrizicola sp.]
MTVTPATLPPSSLPLAHLACAASMLVWAAGLPAADLLIPHMPALTLTAARMGLAAAALLPLWWLIDGSRAVLGAAWGIGLLIGAVNSLGAFGLILGQARSDAVTVAIISAVMPIVGMGIEVVFDGRRITPALILGIGLSLLGGLIALDGGAAGRGTVLGALLAFGSIVIFTFGSRLTVTAYPGLSPLGRTTITLCGGALASLVMLALASAFGLPAPDWDSLGLPEAGAMLVYAFAALALSQLLWIISVGRLGIGLASLHINATPFYVMLILFAVGGPWLWHQVFGAALVVLGVMIAQGLLHPARTRG